MRVTHEAMVGRQLDDLTAVSVERAGRSLDELDAAAAATPSGKEVELWVWVRRVFTGAVAAGVYGPDSPYEDVSLEQDLHRTFSSATMTFLLSIAPSLLPAAHIARERLVHSFATYFAASGPLRGSALVRARLAILQAYGIAAPDIARFETVNGFGVILNVLPTAFWTIWHVFSNADLLADIRDEAERFLGGKRSLGEQAKPEEAMPILASTVTEVLRYHVAGAATRMAMQDHVLANQYFLKKDSVIQMPNRVPHFDAAIWGPDADTFDAYLFGRPDEKKVHAAAFRSWGGGANLCPGRVYATRLVAMMVRGFDIRPGGEEGKGWEEPGEDEGNAVVVVTQPRDKVVVRVTRREGV
ncbi:cytochrome P450 [Massariosphaeria phaeospora]|uniref:Cytochrome P450 n=1 Tax=Massariosphaeria phaeospora TaxID=100035 RepID=A0A7C8MFQ3_9PLEO|nr:cytochrome P450 [Massariosphaeria phaeospora]